MPKKDWEPKWTEKGWTVSFSIEGRRIRRRLGIRDKSLKSIAKLKAQQLYKEEWEAHLTTPIDKGVMFWEAAKGYVNDGGEARFLPKLISYFGQHTTIDEIGEIEIITCAVSIYPDAAPDTHRRQVRVPINAVIRWARGERRRPRTDNPRVRWLTPEEFERLLEVSDNHLIPKIAFLIGSGCRTGEMVALDSRDWRPQTKQAWIAGEEMGAGKSFTATRYVRLPQRSVDLMGNLPEDGKLFRTPKGEAYKLRVRGGGQIMGVFNKARDAAGLEKEGPNKVTPHILRHTWATWFYAQTKDFGGLMDLGGWSKSDMANRYRKMAPDDLADRLYKYGWDFRQQSGNVERLNSLRVVK
jgi:hypothetical protein